MTPVMQIKSAYSHKRGKTLSKLCRLKNYHE